MLDADETACSMGRVMVVSISSGATLGHCVTTARVGSCTLGSRSMGSFIRQMMPRSTSEAILMLTATGRATENRAILIHATFLGRRRNSLDLTVPLSAVYPSHITTAAFMIA